MWSSNSRASILAKILIFVIAFAILDNVSTLILIRLGQSFQSKTSQFDECPPNSSCVYLLAFYIFTYHISDFTINTRQFPLTLLLCCNKYKVTSFIFVDQIIINNPINLQTLTLKGIIIHNTIHNHFLCCSNDSAKREHATLASI